MSIDNKKIKALLDEFQIKTVTSTAFYGNKKEVSLTHKNVLPVLKFLQAAKQRDIKIDFASMGTLKPIDLEPMIFFLPQIIPNFLLAVLDGFRPKNIMDPSSGVGSLLSPIAEILKPESAVGITENEVHLEIGKLINNA